MKGLNFVSTVKPRTGACSLLSALALVQGQSERADQKERLHGSQFVRCNTSKADTRTCAQLWEWYSTYKTHYSPVTASKSQRAVRSTDCHWDLTRLVLSCFNFRSVSGDANDGKNGCVCQPKTMTGTEMLDSSGKRLWIQSIYSMSDWADYQIYFLIGEGRESEETQNLKWRWTSVNSQLIQLQR